MIPQRKLHLAIADSISFLSGAVQPSFLLKVVAITLKRSGVSGERRTLRFQIWRHSPETPLRFKVNFVDDKTEIA
jgi:hypothetical protein